MPEFKLVISNPETGKAYQKNVSGGNANTLIGKKLGEEIDGESIGVSGYKMKVQGGTDSDGFAMRTGIQGPQRRKVLISDKPGFKAQRKGERRKKSVIGNEISEEITQINLKITETGENDLEKMI